MEHASRLDLTSFEDPLFYDKMERARVQGTDRIVMIQSTGLLIQQLVTTISLAGSILFLSPWILLVLVVCVIPAFLGETHFAFMGYSLNFRQTPAKREMDYLRILGGSKETAKELKLFGLGAVSGGPLHKALERAACAKRRTGEAPAVGWGGCSRCLGALGYYGSYAFVIYQDRHRRAGHRHVYLHDGCDRAAPAPTSRRYFRLSRPSRIKRCSSPTCWNFSACSRGILETECAAGSAADSQRI